MRPPRPPAVQLATALGAVVASLTLVALAGVTSAWLLGGEVAFAVVLLVPWLVGAVVPVVALARDGACGLAMLAALAVLALSYAGLGLLLQDVGG